MSDLRVNGGHTINSHRGGRGGGRRGRGGRVGDSGDYPDRLRVPTTDYDFESANAKFDKTAAAKSANPPGEGSNTSDDAIGPVETYPTSAYNPDASFFDSLSSSSNTLAERGPGGGRGRRGSGISTGRIRRDEERAKNMVTFGEIGAVGLLGHGEHVGWNGYGRRGGSRPRRGTPRSGMNGQAPVARV